MQFYVILNVNLPSENMELITEVLQYMCDILQSSDQDASFSLISTTQQKKILICRN